jgi:hypothetical protein
MDKVCIKTSDSFVLFDNVILHVLILFILVSCLFFFYISKTTEKSFNKEFIKIIDTLNFDNVKAILAQQTNPDVVKKMLAKEFNIDINSPLLNEINQFIVNLPPGNNTFLYNIGNKYKTTQDPLKTCVNKNLKQKTIMVIVSLFLIAIIINVLSVKYGRCGVLKHLSIELLIIFTCVGGIEYWFFTNVASKYVPVYPNVILTEAQTKLNNIFK